MTALRTGLRLTAVLTALAASAAFAVPGQLTITDRGLLPGDLTIAPATNSQAEVSAAWGGSQFLVAWTDYRARSVNSQAVQSDGDVFGIRLDAGGAPIDATPFLIAGGMGLQQRPLVAWNGQNWLVVFLSQDPVGGYFETQLRATRISPLGQILDATPLSFPPTQFEPSTIGLNVAGQAGQWLVTRCVYHDTGYGTYLAGQRIDNNGQLLDPTPIMLNDWVYGQTRTIVSTGEYLVVGPDWYDSFTTKARRVGLNAQPIGASFNVPSADLAGNGTEYYVTWIANYTDLVGSRMTNTGTLLNPSGTMLVPNFSGAQSLTHDGSNWWLAWSISNSARTLRISPAGAVLDPGGVSLPISVSGSINSLYSTQLQPIAGGGVGFFWVDYRAAFGSDSNCFALPISAANVPGVERVVSTGTRNQRSVDIAEAPGGGFALAFVSEAANDDRVLVQFFDSGGDPLTSEPIEIVRGPTIGKCGIAWNGALYMLVWDEGASGLSTTQIKGRRIAVDGSFIDPAAFDVMPGFTPDVGALGDDFLVVAAKFGYTPQYIDMWGRRYDGPTGAALDPAPVGLAGGYYSGVARVRSDGSKWLVATHSQWTHDSSQGDAILIRVPPTGPPLGAMNPTPYAGGSGDLDIAFSGSKYLLVWRNNSLSNANNYIAGRLMNADGSFPGGAFVIAEAPGRQLRPTVGWDGGAFIVAWEDQRNQAAFFDARTDVYGIRVSETGALLDAAPFAIVNGPQGDAGATLLCGAGTSYLAAARFTLAPPFDTYRIGLTELRTPTLPGDLNGDGLVDAADGTILCNVILSLDLDPLHRQRADLNGDGRADGRDVQPFMGWMIP